MPEFAHQQVLPLGDDDTDYRRLASDGVSTFEATGHRFLRVEPEVLTRLTTEAMADIAHLMRPAHLAQLRHIVDDPDASDNDRFVALDLLRNATVAAGGTLPMCQDTGTAVVMGHKGQYVLTGGGDEAAISRGVFDTYRTSNLRYSQMAPLTTWDERNTGTNLPAQIDLYAADGDEYRFLFMAKGGGSANKSFLYQPSPAVLDHDAMLAFLDERIRVLGPSACPPYHLAVVIGGLSAELALRTAKLASTRSLDGLPTSGNELGRGFRDLGLEAEVWALTQGTGLGAQFGGRWLCHDVRVVRLPRHAGSCPVAIAVSCSADRQALAKITGDGVFLERLERDPAAYLPEVTDVGLGGDVVAVDLDRPMAEIRAQLSQCPVGTRLSLTGPMVVARDLAHARIKAGLDAGEPVPAYLRDHCVYYAGPARAPDGSPSGSFGPTTASRMDGYVEPFQTAGASLVMVAKGVRSRQVTEACAAHGGFSLGAVGGAAARLARDCIRRVEVLDHADLGMEAVWRIEVVDFPAFVVVDDTGGDFYADLARPVAIAARR